MLNRIDHLKKLSNEALEGGASPEADHHRAIVCGQECGAGGGRIPIVGVDGSAGRQRGGAEGGAKSIGKRGERADAGGDRGVDVALQDVEFLVHGGNQVLEVDVNPHARGLAIGGSKTRAARGSARGTAPISIPSRYQRRS